MYYCGKMNLGATKMKPNQIPRATISPITRVVMVENGKTCLMVKLPADLAETVAKDRIKYSDYMAQLAVKNKTGEYQQTFINALAEFELGFDVLDMTAMFA